MYAQCIRSLVQRSHGVYCATRVSCEYYHLCMYCKAALW